MYILLYSNIVKNKVNYDSFEMVCTGRCHIILTLKPLFAFCFIGLPSPVKPILLLQLVEQW